MCYGANCGYEDINGDCRKPRELLCPVEVYSEEEIEENKRWYYGGLEHDIDTRLIDAIEERCARHEAAK